MTKKPWWVLCAAALACSSAAFADSDPVRLIVSFSAGGPVDMVARELAVPLSKQLGRSVIVENKPGANGAIGALEVIRAKPDGNTLWLTSVGAVAVNPELYPALAYNVQRDFAPVSLVVNNVEILVVNKNNPAKDAPAFVAATKSRQQPTAVASTGIGSIPHLALEQFKDATGAKLSHVPYKGAAPAITDLIGGHVEGFFGDVTGLLSYVNSGTLKVLGTAAPQRHPSLPGVKTLEEQGIKGVDTNNWYALFVSAKTPPKLIQALNQAVRNALTDPAFRQKLLKLGTDPAPSTPAQLDTLLKQDTAKWTRVIRANHIKIE